MARTDTLTNFLTDVASAIKTKKGSQTAIQASNFDTEIANLPSGGSTTLPTGTYFGNSRSTFTNLNWAQNIKFPANSYKLFNSMTSLTDISGLSNVDVSNITSTKEMFNGCTGITRVGNINFPNCNEFTSMFINCSGITRVGNITVTSTNNPNLGGMFQSCTSLTSVGTITIPNTAVASISAMFNNCGLINPPTIIGKPKLSANVFKSCMALTSAPEIDLSEATNLNGMFNTCTALTTVPYYSIPAVTTMGSMFTSCTLLTDTSLDNILRMCISTTSAYTGTKTLLNLGIKTADYPSSRIEALPHYQDFISAGWTIS